MMVIMIQSNTLQFQNIWDFNKCLRAIFSQLNFENFWPYVLAEVAILLKIIQDDSKFL